MDNTNTIRELETTKKELLSWVSQIDSTINTLKLVSSSTPTNGQEHAHLKVVNNDLPEKYREYNKDATVKNKLAFILKKENRFLHIRQIAEILHELEPKVTVKDFVTKLYPALAILKKSGIVIKHAVGASNINSFWGSKNWLDDEGNVKPEHKYDEEQVAEFGAEQLEI